jgi:hypothetical protein
MNETRSLGLALSLASLLLTFSGCADEGEGATGMECYRYPDFPIGYCLWM